MLSIVLITPRTLGEKCFPHVGQLRLASIRRENSEQQPSKDNDLLWPERWRSSKQTLRYAAAALVFDCFGRRLLKWVADAAAGQQLTVTFVSLSGPNSR